MAHDRRTRTNRARIPDPDAPIRCERTGAATGPHEIHDTSFTRARRGNAMLFAQCEDLDIVASAFAVMADAGGDPLGLLDTGHLRRLATRTARIGRRAAQFHKGELAAWGARSARQIMKAVEAEQEVLAQAWQEQRDADAQAVVDAIVAVLDAHTKRQSETRYEDARLKRPPPDEPTPAGEGDRSASSGPPSAPVRRTSRTPPPIPPGVFAVPTASYKDVPTLDIDRRPLLPLAPGHGEDVPRPRPTKWM